MNSDLRRGSYTDLASCLREENEYQDGEEDNPGETGSADQKPPLPGGREPSYAATLETTELDAQVRIVDDYMERVSDKYGKLKRGTHPFGVNFLKW